MTKGALFGWMAPSCRCHPAAAIMEFHVGSTNDGREAIREFWRWWQRRKGDFDALGTASDQFWDVALGQLQRLDGRLRFEVSEANSNDREFIITAEGNRDAFPLVNAIVRLAPQISDWKFIALKPPMGFDFTTNYEGIVFRPRDMWFLALQGNSSPSELGLRIAVPFIDIATKRQAYNAVAVILDTALGEMSAALDIQFFEVCALPEQPRAEGYFELPLLPHYLEWRNKKGRNG